MQRTILITCAILIAFLAATVRAEVDEATAEAFGRLVIQHDGRLKPVDTFARHKLLTFSHRSTIGGRSAASWLADALLDPEAAAEVPLFKIHNDEVVIALGMEPVKGHRYSFSALSEAIGENSDMMQALSRKPQEERSLVDTQLVDTYSKSMEFLELVYSFTGLLPTIVVDDPELAADLELQPGQAVNYLYFMMNLEKLRSLISESEASEDLSSSEGDGLHQLMLDLNDSMREQSAQSMTILGADAGEPWASPWKLMDGRPLTDVQREQLAVMERLVAALGANDSDAMLAAVNDLESISPTRLDVGLELVYNKSRPFYISLYFYIGAFLALLASMVFWPVWGRRLSVGCVTVGVLLQAGGLLMRMLIMGRPPVSNLYESIVFVGFTAALLGLIMEFMRKDRLGLLIASVLGAAFHFVGFRYASEGDTLGMLVAVLDSNFWLATHVVTIVIGYGAAMVASLVGHILLVQLAVRPNSLEKTSSLMRLARGSAGIALLFTLVGTILGGIWADQSWGRFWGWDPKENGALLIVLWLLFVMHLHIARRAGPAGYAAFLSLTSITVMIAWFGVNLLNVGLHSYGFTQNIVVNLAVFCIAEVVFIAAFYVPARIRLAPA